MHYYFGFLLTLEDNTMFALDIYENNMLFQALHADSCSGHEEQNLDS